MASVLQYDRIGYRMLATLDGYMFEFDNPPVLNPQPYRLQDGSLMCPGQYFTSFRGRKTSAGYPSFRLALGALCYVGSFDGLDGVLLLFRWVRPGESGPDSLFYGWKAMGNGSLFFSTPAVAGRVVETTLVGRSTLEEAMRVPAA